MCEKCVAMTSLCAKDIADEVRAMPADVQAGLLTVLLRGSLIKTLRHLPSLFNTPHVDGQPMVISFFFLEEEMGTGLPQRVTNWLMETQSRLGEKTRLHAERLDAGGAHPITGEAREEPDGEPDTLLGTLKSLLRQAQDRGGKGKPREVV